MYTGGRKKILDYLVHSLHPVAANCSCGAGCRLPSGSVWHHGDFSKAFVFPYLICIVFFVWTIDDIFLDSGILHLKLVTATRLATCSKKHVAKTLEALMYNT